MITVRKSEERRRVEDQNQKTWMTFDLENAADPLREGFSSLHILNEEIISPGSGVLFQAREDMIIVTYVREGIIIQIGPVEKPDLMEAKDFHALKAAPGAQQYAFNVSRTEEAHVFQCGFNVREGGFKPGAMKKFFTHVERHGLLKLIASPDGSGGSLPMGLDIQMFSTFIHKGNRIVHELRPDRSAWLHVVKGEIQMDNLRLGAGDGAGFSGEKSLSFTAKCPAEILLFDLYGQVSKGVRKSLSGEKLAALAR